MALWVVCMPVVWETGVQSQVESYQILKWYLMLPCLRLSITRYRSRVKWSNPEKGVTPSPMPWCSSYWKESLQVILTTVANLFIFILQMLQEFKTNKKLLACRHESWTPFAVMLPRNSPMISNVMAKCFYVCLPFVHSVPKQLNGLCPWH